MEHASSLEGWDSGLVDGAALEAAIELAFDYRGDVTLTLEGGTDVVGYLFNRDHTAPTPFVEVFERAGGKGRRLPYAAIRRIRLTGRDTAAGNSYAAWLRSRAAKATETTRSV